jgi:4-hydroxy-2-oxoglutarate aldolase
MTVNLRGIFAPVITPFTAAGGLDRAAYETNARAHLDNGLQGIVVAGSTGEAPLLDEQERDSLVEWTRAVSTRGQLVIAGIGAESTRATLDRARRAADRGADAALVVAPHYFGSAMTDDAVRAHYRRVADESPLPVILYNIPKYMHFRLGGTFVQEMSRHQNVAGIKDSSGDRDSLAEYLSAQSDSFSVLTGNGQLWRTALDMGARGGILAVALFAPDLTVAVWEAVGRADGPSADRFQARLSPVAKEIVGDMGIAGVKAAMDAIGLRGGLPRSPLLPLDGARSGRVKDLLRDAQLAVAV